MEDEVANSGVSPSVSSGKSAKRRRVVESEESEGEEMETSVINYNSGQTLSPVAARFAYALIFFLMEVMINLTRTPVLGFNRFNHHCQFFFKFIFENVFYFIFTLFTIIPVIIRKLAKCG